MLANRWVIFQHGGAHMRDSLEVSLHAAGKPFLWGAHVLDDPDVAALHREQNERAAMLPEQAAGRAWPTIERLGDRVPSYKVLTKTIKAAPARPKAGGHAHLSWCYANLALGTHGEEFGLAGGLIPACGQILSDDPEVRLAVWVQHPHPDVLDLVIWLKANWRARHATIVQKRNNTAQVEFSGRYHACELALWQAADLRYMSRAGLIAKGAGRLWRDLKFDPLTIPIIHSGLSIADAEGILARAETFLAGMGE